LKYRDKSCKYTDRQALVESLGTHVSIKESIKEKRQRTIQFTNTIVALCLY